MRYVVGYTPNVRGRDALNLAVAMARSLDVGLDIAYVVKVEETFSRALKGGGNYTQMVEAQAKRWLTEAAQLIPDDVDASFHLHRAASSATGLLELAEIRGAGAVLVGGAKVSTWRRHGIGSVSNALLHRATLPVILAPREADPQERLTRIDCAVSPEEDGMGLVAEAVATMNRTGLPLRLVTLVDETKETSRGARATVEDMLRRSPVQPEDADLLSVEVGVGRSIPEAVDSVHWGTGSLLLAGSSKLAEAGRLFLSSTTSKILTALPIPLVVVPRDYQPGRNGSTALPWTGALPAIRRD
ncbi:universal stress protein [Rothia kristinae]|uniref:Universal stress protein n=1 Tax=Rothia kristinae TaxID=37923 RepID=A0A7T3F8V8_9MICC|nr:universal stress protein [Rothia kristinae]QPT54463.1 universal stress protein [Rothia kristinae]